MDQMSTSAAAIAAQAAAPAMAGLGNKTVSEFQFVAVFVAIIFGLSLTHVMSSAARSIFANSPIQLRDIRLVWTGFVVMIILVNWSVAISWRSAPTWSFDVFLVLILWAGSHYALAIMLYPLGGEMTAESTTPNWRPEPLLGAFIFLAIMDMAQTAVREDLFGSVYYVPFTVHYIVLAVATLLVRRAWFRAFSAWYFLISIFTWSLLVRRFLQ
jgi:hypothetical protein